MQMNFFLLVPIKPLGLIVYGKCFLGDVFVVMVMVMVFIYRIFYMYIFKCGLHLTTQPMNHEIAQRPDQHTGNSTPYSLR